MTTAQRNTVAGGPDAPAKWGRNVDLAGYEFFSILIDPQEAAELHGDGVCGLMQMPPDVLTDVLFDAQGETAWFTPQHVIWGLSLIEYDDDDGLGVRCSILGYR